MGQSLGPESGASRRPDRRFNFELTLSIYLTGCCPSLRALQEIVDQFGTAVTHLDIERFNTVSEVVEGPDRRDSHEQTDGRGDQGFRNTTGHSADTGRLRSRDRLERVHDADDGSEQSDERCC